MIKNEQFKGQKWDTESQIENQIILIQGIHKILMGYYCEEGTRISSSLGKMFEGIWVEIKRLKNDYKERIAKGNINIMDEFIIKEGGRILESTEISLNSIRKINYVDMIKRSMKRNEICLGRVDEGNLRVFDNIEVGSLKNISYNLVEEDVYEYLKRLKRRKLNINLDRIIDKYVEISHLGKESAQYIKILLSIPYDTLKQWNRYKYNKKELSVHDYYKNINEYYEYEKNYM